MRTSWVLLVELAVGFIPLYAEEKPSRPNILFAIGDNWAYPHAGALGDPTVKTPVFDRIAEEGILFTHAFCTVPSCSPARSTLLTGKYPHQLGEAASLWSNFEKFPVFTDMLEKAGYEVAFTGKGWSPGRYLEHGWEQNPVGKEYESFAEFMEMRDREKPFFFWHGNIDAALGRWKYGPEAWGGMDPDTVTVPKTMPDTVEVRESILAYYGGVQRQDAVFGRAVERLEDEGMLDDTLVVHTSDNGWQMPRGLANCYDWGVRIPLAMRWGKRLDAGRKIDEFVALIDFAPTFLELAGVSVPEDMVGESLAAVLTGEKEPTMREHIFLERERHANVRQNNGSYPIRSIRNRDFLYIWNLRSNRWPAGDPDAWMSVGDFGDVDGSWAKHFILENKDNPDIVPFYDLTFGKRPAEELYDLKSDPDQVVNVAGDPARAKILEELREKVEAWMEETSDPRLNQRFDDFDRYSYFGGTVYDNDGTRKPPREPWLERKKELGR